MDKSTLGFEKWFESTYRRNKIWKQLDVPSQYLIYETAKFTWTYLKEEKKKNPIVSVWTAK